MKQAGHPGEVFAAFLRLGLTAFGGPIAHLGYFRRALVERRQWLSEAAYAEIVGLCQLLPGPTSSQVGFALGLMRAGPLGGLAAWAGFTIPSALLMILFAYGADRLNGPIGGAAVHGLKLVALPVVAQAVVGMARTLISDLPRAAIAVAAALALLTLAMPAMQLVVILAGAIAGLCLHITIGSTFKASAGWLPSRRAGIFSLTLFALLLVLSIAAANAGGPFAIVAILYRAGGLVFGGGHVVLPLLRAGLVPQWIDDRSFLAGYGFTQAMPGPLFSFGAYLGARLLGIAGALIALVAIFLPGLLLVTGLLPLRDALQGNPRVQSAIAGVNAAVVGILAAALYNPLWTGGVASGLDIAIALVGFAMLWRWRLPPLIIVLFTLVASMAQTVVGPLVSL